MESNVILNPDCLRCFMMILTIVQSDISPHCFPDPGPPISVHGWQHSAKDGHGSGRSRLLLLWVQVHQFPSSTRHISLMPQKGVTVASPHVQLRSLGEHTQKDQAPVPLTVFRSNSQFDQILQSFGLKRTLPITTKFCTRHDSVTVVTCAKFRCVRLRIFQTRALSIMIEFRIRSKYR